jgi:hypothetical protein
MGIKLYFVLYEGYDDEGKQGKFDTESEALQFIDDHVSDVGTEVDDFTLYVAEDVSEIKLERKVTVKEVVKVVKAR